MTDCREEFEKEFAKKVNITRLDEGYRTLYTENLWVGWKAAWKASAASPDAQNVAVEYRCGHCGYEGHCYGNGFSAPWCRKCERNDKLEALKAYKGEIK